MTRAARRGSALFLMVLGLASPAEAQIVQSVQFGGGWFWPKGFEGRTSGDVLVANLTQPDVLPGVSGSLEFDIGDFAFWSVFGEWNIAFNRRIEASAGIGFYQETVPSRYRDLVDSSQGFSDITQDLKLRQIPFTGLVRFLGGRPGRVQPYAGGGITAISFQYTETGDFVDPVDLSVFCAGTPGCAFPSFEATGLAYGPVVVGGVRFPIGGDIFGFTAEGRYQWVTGDLPSAADCQADSSKCFAFGATKIDLSGFTFNMAMLIRF